MPEDVEAAAPVLLTVEDGVAHLVLNRPSSGNAMTVELAEGLGTCLAGIAQDDTVRAVILRGNGRMFCAGGDLAAMHTAPDRGAFVHELALVAHEAVRLLARLEKPVIAAVHGAAAGAGLSLTLLADVVLATPGTTFVTAYTSVGLSPDCGQSWLLPRAIGLQRSLSLTLDPRRVAAEEARTLGIVSSVVPEAALVDEALAVARRFVAGPAHALGAARALIRRSHLDGFDAHLDLEARTIARLASTPETGELIASFLAP